ncbi:ABC transporter permease [Pseudalkalibacillus salsuginis]|uniref:ABC transporter permease n=1 Tax=Pseudalkalibacillus salsuginis TaxID=2910972 RepID=UPI001F269C8D|nr:ABC transporter permease [Pseudalkalibacillus salsuginis]MCF6410120.1 ABC transporter permease [Pseudalkalibacillus salsuginis]
MKSVITVIKEQIEHFYLVRRLSLYELKSSNSNNYLGMAWELINPLIQVAIYWFVFGYGIRKRADITLENGLEVPFLQWMLAGIIIWFFFYQSTIKGSKSIYTRLRMLSKMNFPMSVIPNYIIFSQFYIHAALGIITILVMQFSGFPINIYYLQFIYFIFATFMFIFALALVTSTLATIIRDVQMFLQATLRMLLYLSPILWQVSSIDNEFIQLVMKINPLYYLIEGYRAGFFGIGWYFIENWEYTLYFWAVTGMLLIIGSTIHVKFRRHFIDFL